MIHAKRSARVGVATLLMLVACGRVAAGRDSVSIRCSLSKRTATAKALSQTLACHAKGKAKGVPTDATCLAKAEQKLAVAIGKVSRLCPGTVPGIQDWIDSCAGALLDDVPGSGKCAAASVRAISSAGNTLVGRCFSLNFHQKALDCVTQVIAKLQAKLAQVGSCGATSISSDLQSRSNGLLDTIVFCGTARGGVPLRDPYGRFRGATGIAMDGGGDVFVVDFLNDRLQKFDNGGTFLSGFPGLSGGYSTDLPRTVAVSGDGSIYIGDSGEHLLKFDAAGTLLSRTLIRFGVAALAIDGSGNVFTLTNGVDYLDQVYVKKFDSNGTLLTSFGISGFNTGMMYYPKGIAVAANGDVFVADSGNSRVAKFTNDGTFVTSWGTAGHGTGELDRPTTIAVDGSGNVLVGDDSLRVQKFDAAGTFLVGWGGPGTGAGQFGGITGIAVDAGGDVFVTDGSSTTDRVIQVFDGTGNLLRTFGRHGGISDSRGVAVDADGNVYVVDRGYDRIEKIDAGGNLVTDWGSTGNGPGQFSGATDVAVDASGNVYVADTGNDRIEAFDRNGVFRTAWGSTGSLAGQFVHPFGIGVDASGNVYVSDQGNDRIEVFDGNGTHLASWGGTGSSLGQFAGPSGVVVDAADNVLVADTGNDRIQKFDHNGTFLSFWDAVGPVGIEVSLVGNVFVTGTDPVGSPLAEAANGALLGPFFSSPTSDPLVDIAVSPSGDVYAGNGTRVLNRFACP